MHAIFLLLFVFSSTFAFQINYGQNRFSQLVIFGDSLSDTGNVYRLTNYTYPICPPYYQGRFCNGPNWIDRLSTIEKLNYAYGSATTDSNYVQGYAKFNTIPVPGVRQQIAMYFQNTSTIDFTRTAYVVWAGGNDFIFNSSATITGIVRSYLNGVQDLLVGGAKNILVFNQPPSQDFPYIKRRNQTIIYTAITASANIGISIGLAALQRDYTNASIYMFDVYALISKILSNTSSVTFEDTVDQCWATYNTTTVLQFCSDPTKYAFLDDLHLTTPIHQIISDTIHWFLSYRFSRNTLSCYIRSFNVGRNDL